MDVYPLQNGGLTPMFLLIMLLGRGLAPLNKSLTPFDFGGGVNVVVTGGGGRNEMAEGLNEEVVGEGGLQMRCWWWSTQSDPACNVMFTRPKTKFKFTQFLSSSRDPSGDCPKIGVRHSLLRKFKTVPLKLSIMYASEYILKSWEWRGMTFLLPS